MKILCGLVLFLGLLLNIVHVATQTLSTDLQFFDVNSNYIIQAVLTPGATFISSIKVRYVSTPIPSDYIVVSCSATLSSQEACSTFRLVTLNQDNTQWLGNLVLNQALNFQQTPSYRLVLEAKSGSIYNTQTILINVVDKVPPVFISSLSATINPVTNGTIAEVTRLVAVDGDSAKKGRVISYFIVSNPGSYFSVDQFTGRVSTTKDITLQDPNWSSLGYVVIGVKAVVSDNTSYIPVDDPKSYTMAILVVTLAYTETAPVFGSSVYSTSSLYEKSAAGTPVPGLEIIVTSKNPGAASFFELFLDNYNDVFLVTPTNASGQVQCSLLVVNPALINYDTGRSIFTFNIIARNMFTPLRLRSTTSVTIYLLDTDDHSPVFTQSAYTASISELATSGTPILSVLATDGDRSPQYGNASIVYLIVPRNNRFRINRQTGSISLAPCGTPGIGSCLDYEQTTYFVLTVTAQDLYGDGLLASTDVTINIINEIDNPPVFSSSEYSGSINEYAPTLNLPLPQVQATTVEPLSIVYGLAYVQCNCWTINATTGVITNTRPVNWTDTPNQQGYFLFPAFAVYAGSAKYNVTVPVRIRVELVNKFTPTFIQGLPSNVSLLTNLPQGTVIAQLSATDQDSPYTPDGTVRYRIESGCQDQFAINATTGAIYVAQGGALAAGTCRLAVSAFDLGTPSLSSSFVLGITVLPSMSDQPVFVPSTIPVKVAQNAQNGSVAATISAFASPNATLAYRLGQPVTAFDVNNQPVTLTDSEKSLFVLNPTTGLLTLNGPLNRDRIATWSAPVIAVNTAAAPPTTGTGTVVVAISSVNTLPPVFVSPWTPANPSYNITILQNTQVRGYVTTMIATDPSNNNVFYAISNSTPADQFAIDINTGIVTLSNMLSYDASSPPINFVVTATDNGVPPLTSTATVNVQVSLQNTKAPVFSPDLYTPSMYDSVTSGYQVVTVSASFADSATFGPVRYALTSNNNGQFIIDPVSGVISVAPGATFSKAVIGTAPIVLVVSAYNNASDPTQRQTSYATVNINVLAANPAPVFGQPSYSVTVPDSAAANQYVIKVAAASPDPAISKYIAYSIQSSTAPGVFSIDGSNGLISTAKPLTGLAGTYYLTVIADATRSGTPNTVTPVNVTITVTAPPGSLPVWSSSSTAVVREDSPLNTFVYTAQALSTSGATVLYSLTDTNGQPVTDFIIDQKNGNIVTNAVLNWDVKQFYTLRVTAKDTGNNQTSSLFLYVQVIKVSIAVFPSYPQSNITLGCCAVPYNFGPPLTEFGIVAIGRVIATDPRRIANVQYSITSAEGSLFTINKDTGDILVNATLLYIMNYPSYTDKLRVRATVDGNYAVLPIPGCQCSNRSDVSVSVQVRPPQPLQIVFAGNNKTCISEDAEINDTIGGYSSNYPSTIYSIASVTASFPNGTTQNVTQAAFFKLSTNSPPPTWYLNLSRLVNQYTRSYFTITINATYTPSGSYLFLSATTSFRVWVTQPRYEILVTTDTNYTTTLENTETITNSIKNTIGSSATQVCIIAYKDHLVLPDEHILNTGQTGVIDKTKTDIFMYIIDGRTSALLTDFHILDSAYGIDERVSNMVIGITAANVYWAYFDYIPIAAAVGLIIGLLLILLLMLCCCICWTGIVVWCTGLFVKEKEPLLYHDTTASVVAVPIAYANPMTRRLLEDQQMTMNFNGRDQLDYDGMAMAYAPGRGAYDAGDGDVFHGSMSKRQLVTDSIERSQQQQTAHSPEAFNDVLIVAPLASPTATSYSATGSVTEAIDNVQTTTETTNHFDERMSFHDDGLLRSSQAVSDVPMSASVGGFSGRQSTIDGNQPSDSAAPSTVTLNDPNRTSSARIGATLYQAPTPYSGFAPTQNVVSAASYPTTDRRNLSIQKEIVMPGVAYDDYEEDEFVGRSGPPAHLADDMYQGEIHLSAMPSAGLMSSSRSGSNLYENETRFML